MLVKFHTEYLTLNLPTQMGFLNLTPQVEAAFEKSGAQEGIVLVKAWEITQWYQEKLSSTPAMPSPIMPWW